MRRALRRRPGASGRLRPAEIEPIEPPPGARVCLLAIELVSDDIAGVFTISQIFRGAFQSAYLGYYANQRHAGQGLMREAMDQVLDHAFGPLALHRIEANIQPGNQPSIALARGAGFRLEGFSPRYLLIGGQWRDHERDALTA